MPVLSAPIARLRDVLREAPITIPAFGAFVLFVIWSTSDAGYPLTHWTPGALIVLGLLAVAFLALPLRYLELPRGVRVALVCLALFTAFSYLSILWAQAPGDAWEGANRTLLYLLVFTLFAVWPQRGASAVLLLGTWALAMIVLAVVVLIHVDSAANPAALFSEGRLKYPGDYENANAAVWCMVLWPAVLLTAHTRIPWAVRGVLAGGAVLLADLALLSQSRGSLYATIVLLILVFAIVPNRVRSFAVIVPVAAGVGVTAPIVLRVGDRLLHGGDVPAALHNATAAILIAAALVGLIVAGGAALQEHEAFSPTTVARLHRATAAFAIAALVAILAGGWIAARDPLTRVEHAWHTFKGGYGANNSKVNRLVSGLGSGRYDFYRVALDEFAAHPLLGIGADNFAQQYLAKGRGEQTPHYPHSVEARTLSQTGLIGTALGLTGLIAALLVACRAAFAAAARRADPLAAAAAAAALGGFAYWLVHGSFDWFWEFAGLGAPAFALLGLACSLAPRRASNDATGPTQAPPSGPARSQLGSDSLRRRSTIAGAAALALIAAASLIAPWLSQLRIERAARIWPTAPGKAYGELTDAASLNPLSDEPYLLSGSIALRFGDLVRADRDFSRALQRDHEDAYATLERGAVASALGRPDEAVRLLERTLSLNPHDELVREVLAYVRRGGRVSVPQLNRTIFQKAQRLK